MLAPMLLLFFACDTPPEEPSVTWHRDVRPLADQHCSGCHADGQVAGFGFDDSTTVQALGPTLVDSVLERRMPPYGFDQDCRETTDSLRLDEQTLATFAAWADEGYPLGDEQDYVQPEGLPQPPSYPAHDLEIRPAEGWDVPLDRPDAYRCMVTDTVFEEDTWVIGMEALIDREEIAHHLLYWTVPEESAEQLLAMDAQTDEPGIPCYDSWAFWQLDGLDTFGGWAPGTPVWYQDGSERLEGMLVPAGSRVVIEAHYNSLATDATSMVDSSGVGLWTLPSGEVPDDVLVVSEVSDYQLDIPAGAEEHVEGGSLDIESTGTLVSVNPHMHLLGTRMDATIVRADGSEECLTRVDPYDFNWQWEYSFVEPVTLQAGDRIDMTCTFDNSAANQPVIDGEQQEPRDVEYGDGTTDEMCIHYLTWSVPYEDWR